MVMLQTPDGITKSGAAASGSQAGARAPIPGQAPVNPQSALFNQFNQGVLAPMNAQADQTLLGLGMQGSLLDANYATQQGQLQQQLGYGLQGLGLDQQSLGIQQGALGRQQSLDPQLADLQRQLFGVTQAGIDQSKQQAQFQADQSKRAEWSGATSRGAVNTTGHTTALSDIGQNLQFQLGNIGRQEQSLGIQKNQFELSETERKAQLADEGKTLDIQSKRLGLSKDELTSRIDNAITQLGLNRVLSNVDIIKAINDTQNGRFNALSGVLGQIAQVDPSLLAQSNVGGATGGSGGGKALAPQQAASMIKQAGFKDPVTALAVAWAESGLNNGEVGTNSGPGIASGYQGTKDQGLFQINAKAHPGYKYDPNDVQGNIQQAYQISGGGTNFSAWSTYNSGAYKKYLAQARQALGM